jgi:hypothetical protein
MEFLIRSTDGEWFNLKREQFQEAFLPASYPAQPIPGWGDYRIEIAGCQISFSDEDPGIQVCFEGDVFSDEEAAKIVAEISGQISKITGQASRVIEI